MLTSDKDRKSLPVEGKDNFVDENKRVLNFPASLAFQSKGEMFDASDASLSLFFQPKRPEHEGLRGYLHGGVSALVMDEAQAKLCFRLGYFVMTDKLTIHYQKATSIHQTICVKARVTSIRRRRMYITASIHSQEGELLTSSKGSFYIMPDRILERLFKALSPEEQAFARKEVDIVKRAAKANQRKTKKKRQAVRSAQKKDPKTKLS